MAFQASIAHHARGGNILGGAIRTRDRGRTKIYVVSAVQLHEIRVVKSGVSGIIRVSSAVGVMAGKTKRLFVVIERGAVGVYIPHVPLGCRVPERGGGG